MALDRILHGNQEPRTEQQVRDERAARDVAPGQSWAFHDHRTMAEVIDAERRDRAARQAGG